MATMSCHTDDLCTGCASWYSLDHPVPSASSQRPSTALLAVGRLDSGDPRLLLAGGINNVPLVVDLVIQSFATTYYTVDNKAQRCILLIYWCLVLEVILKSGRIEGAIEAMPTLVLDTRG